ncbi:MAG: acyl-CoA reductase [Peptococcaceae bacterium]|nr:acyl-CoA reductase [Peptococcaceae bacterium]
MPVDLSKLKLLCHFGNQFEEMNSLRSFPPFSEEGCSFLSDLSYELLQDKRAKAFPDIIAFAFFCRRSHVQRMKSRYQGILDDRLGRGVAFHIAPSNVPVQFAYSLAVGILSGNANVVRASSKSFPQTEIICQAINKVFESGKHDCLKNYISILSYDRDHELTAYFSSRCDTRLIWGGDNTIEQIRKADIPPRAFDITFADRYSLCVIHADEYLQKYDPQKTARQFYNDTYFHHQKACSSPSLIVWFGESGIIAGARKVFWEAMYKYTKYRYALEPSVAIDKYVTFCRSAVRLDHVLLEEMPDNLIQCIKVDSLSPDISDYRCAGGSFMEYHTENLESIKSIVDRKVQTLAYIAFQPEFLKKFVMEQGLLGIDRIVPVGKTADFSLVWDGYDLIMGMSRIIQVK